ncbi:MAG: choice-of-anchor Q domain-containing protein [Ilumatobacteraceae bacterium]
MSTVRQHPHLRICRLITGLAVSGATIGAWGADIARAVPANTIIVSNRADDGSATSLRGAIDAINADGGDWTIQLEPGIPYIVNRQCADGDLNDNHGGDLDLLTDAKVTFAASYLEPATISVVCAGERAVDHLGLGTVRFEHVRITGGNTANGTKGDQSGDRDGKASQDGGAIRSTGRVELVDVELDHNRTGNGGSGAPPLVPGAGGKGGAAGRGAAVAAKEIFAFDSRVHHNTTGSGGSGGNGAGANQAGGDGGVGGVGTFSATSIELRLVEIADNTLGAGGKGGAGLGAGAHGGRGGYGGSGGALFADAVVIDASTIARNVAGVGGNGGNGNGGIGGTGGYGGEGGGVWTANASITRSTIHANVAADDGLSGAGALPPGGGSYGGGLVLTNGGDVTFSTVTANTASIGANVAGAVTLRASITGEAKGGPSCTGPVVNEAYSVHGDASCGGDPALTFADLRLAPLADNGGRTHTRLPLPDSPVASLIPDDVCPTISVIARDQRDYPRPDFRCEPGAVELPRPGASVFVPVAPARVFDTRQPGPTAGSLAANETRTVQFAGAAGIPATGVTAVAFNLTLVDAAGPGFVTVSPSGSARPLASSLNAVRAGQTVPNLVIVPLGSGGKLDFYAQRGGHLVADVVGYYQQAAVGTAGRTISLDPTRLFDTRAPGPVGGKLAPGGVLTFDVTGVGGVPASGVSAVVVNLTGTDATAAGFVTSFPGGQPRPLASTLNLDGPGHTAANLTIVPVAADGTVSFYSDGGVHLVADVTGYVTDASAPVSTQGLFVPIQPTRMFDTRQGGGVPVAAGGSLTVDALVGDIQHTAEGVIINLTATQAAGPGYVTGWKHGKPRPVASNLNLTEVGETRANAALLPIGQGQFDLFAWSSTHLLADAFGYLLPAPLFVIYEV